MRDENRNNWLVRFAALLLACVLWLYVMNEQNPLIERSFTVSLAKINLAENMMVNNVPESVNVTIKGQRTVLSRVAADDLHAFVDLDGLKKGRHSVDVKVKAASGEVVDVNPNTLFLDMDTISERTVDVEARIVGVPNSGVTVGKMEINPPKVVVEGASSRVANMSRVIVLVDISDKDKNFETDAYLVPINLDGTEMYDLKVTPSQVHINAIMLKQLATNSFPIKPIISGTLRKGLKISSIKTVPEAVKLTAEPAVLGNMTEVETAPIILDKLEGDIELQMPLNLPEKVLADAHTVLVNITFERENVTD